MMAQLATNKRTVAFAALVIALATASAAGEPWAKQPDFRVTSAPVWLFPVNACSAAILPISDLLYVTLLESHQIAIMDRAGHPRVLIAADRQVVTAAYDATRRLVYVTAPLRRGVYRLPVGSDHLSGFVPTPRGYDWLTIVGRLAYATCAKQAQVDILDLDTLRVVGQIPVSGPPLRAVVAGGKMYVSSGPFLAETNYKLVPGRVDVVNLATRRAIKTLTVPGAHPSAMAWDGGRFVYVSSSEMGALVRIDTTTDALDPGFRVAIGARPNDLVIDSQRGLVYLSCDAAAEQLSIVSVAERRELLRVWAGQGYMAADRDETGRVRRLYVPNVNYDAVVVIDPDQLLPGL